MIADLSKEQLVERAEEFIADVRERASAIEILVLARTGEPNSNIDVTGAYEVIRLMRYAINMLSDNIAAIRRVQMNTDLEIQKHQKLYAIEQERKAEAERAPETFSFGED